MSTEFAVPFTRLVTWMCSWMHIFFIYCLCLILSVAPTSPSEPSDSHTPECRTACAGIAEAVEATPCRPSWVSRAVVSRLNDSPIVPTIRRVRSTLCGTQVCVSFSPPLPSLFVSLGVIFKTFLIVSIEYDVDCDSHAAT